MASSSSSRPAPTGSALLPADDPYLWSADNAARHGPVFRLPLRRHVLALSGAEGLGAFTDEARVSRAEGVPPALRAMFSNPPAPSGQPEVAALSLLDGAAHERRMAPLRQHLGASAIATWLPIFDQSIDNALRGWWRRQILGVNEAADVLLWRLMCRITLGSEDGEDQRLHARRVFLFARGARGVRAEEAAESHAALFAWYGRALARPDAAPDAVGPRLLAAEGAIEAEVQSDVHHMLMAGRNTWMVFVGLMRELARAPEHLARAREALTESPLSAEATPSLPALLEAPPALLQVIREVRRMYSLLSWSAAEARRDFELDGVRIEAGSTVLGALFATTHDPVLFPDPYAFRPERWDRPTARQLEAWVPHGAGQGGHRCPAEDLVGVLLTLFTARLLTRLSWEPERPDEPLERSERGIFPALGYRCRTGHPDRPRVDRPSPPRPTGTRYPAPSSGRPSEDLRVAVVGGGIAGLAMARALRRCGHRRVTVFEAAARVAGKCETRMIDGLPYNLGALLVCEDKAVARLAAEVGVALEPFPDYRVYDIDRREEVGKRWLPTADRRRTEALLARLRPGAEPGYAHTPLELSAPIGRWLTHHGLRALGDEIGAFYTSCGYGFLSDDLPAAQFLAFLQTEDIGDRRPHTPVGGFQGLLEALAGDLDLRLGCRISGVERDEDGVTLIHAGGAERYDRLILACPPQEALRWLDATPVERSLLGAVRHHRYYTVVLEARGLPRDGLFLVRGHLHDPATVGHVTGFGHFQPSSDIYVLYAYGSEDLSDAEVEQRVREDVARMGGTAGRTHLLRRWDYFPHVGSHDMARGYHRHLEALQGCRHTWYAGSLPSFELTEAVTAYAEALAGRFFVEEAPREPRVLRSAPPWIPEQGSFEPGFRTVIDALRHRLETTPDRLVYGFLDKRGMKTSELSFRQLAGRASLLARRLLDREGLSPGDRVLLIYPPDSDEFPVGLWACLLAGLVAVPHAPLNPADPAADLPRFAHVIADCGARVALTSAAYRSLDAWVGLRSRVGALLGRGVALDLPDLRWVVTSGLRTPRGPIELPTQVDPDAVAYLQYTSGSTTHPRGAVITHGRLAHNLELGGWASNTNQESIIVAWVPWFHDMGLVGGFLNAVWNGARYYYLSALHFLRDPGVWFEAVHRYRATITAAPNFGYELVARRVHRERTRDLDLSCVHIFIQGGEVARPGTLERFVARFGAHGARFDAFRNVYGIAESVVYVCGLARCPRMISVDAEALELGRALPVDCASPGARHLLSCGSPHPECGEHLLIVDPESLEICAGQQVGEIWVASPSICAGYHGQDDPRFSARPRGATADAPSYLRTGDMGFLDGDELYITGRRKEMLILGGRNLYPYDLEDAIAEAHPALRRGCICAFSVDDGEEEQLVVVAEVRRRDEGLLRDEVAPAIRQLLDRRFHVAPSSVVFLSRGRLPKTTSGKIQRAACRAAWRAGALPVILDVRASTLPAARRPPSASVSAVALPDLGPGSGAEAIEGWLVAWLAYTLGVALAEIDPTQPNRELGLDSLQLLPVVADLEQALGRRVDPAALYDHPTIRELAAYLADPEAGPGPTPSPQLVYLGARGRAAPLICLPPAGGSALAYMALARALGDEASVLALQAAALTPALRGQVEPSSIPASAAHYLELLRAGGLTGPWRLCGYSLGGVIAVEMARQLLERGETVRTLILIDAPAPIYAEDLRLDLGDEAVGAFLDRAAVAGLAPGADQGALADALRDELVRGFTRMLSHRPAPLPAGLPVTLLRATRHDPLLGALLRHPAFEAADFGWGALLPGLHVVPIAGDHLSVMAEESASTASAVGALLA